jgi:type IV pilus assembly protein PilZ
MRHRCQVPVVVGAGRNRLRGETEDVSFSGLFVVVEAELATRQLVVVDVELPELGTFSAHAMVAFTRPAGTDRRAGAGLKFFGLDREALGRWVKFVRGVRERELAGPPAENRRAPRAAVVLRVRPQGVDALVDVYTRDLADGGMFLETEQPLLVGSRLSAEIVHPETGEPFELECVVRRVVKTPTPGLGVEFVGLDALRQQQLHEFVSSVAPPILIEEEWDAP